MKCDNCDRDVSEHDENGYCETGTRFESPMTEVPMCPHCGKCDQDWWEGTDLKGDGDEETVSCPFCEKDYVTTMYQTVEFVTTVRNPKKEAEAEARRREEMRRHQERLRLIDEAAVKFPPGTRVRNDKGRDGVVVPQDRQPGSYLKVQFSGQNWTSNVDPLKLEVICI